MMNAALFTRPAAPAAAGKPAGAPADPARAGDDAGGFGSVLSGLGAAAPDAAPEAQDDGNVPAAAAVAEPATAGTPADPLAAGFVALAALQPVPVIAAAPAAGAATEGLGDSPDAAAEGATTTAAARPPVDPFAMLERAGFRAPEPNPLLVAAAEIAVSTEEPRGDTAGAPPPGAAPAAGVQAGDVQQLAQALGRLQGGERAPTADSQPATATLREPVGTPRWADELGTKLTYMTQQGQVSGSLRLSPEHLGPLEVRILVGQENTSVFFGAQHADTRSALQEALPRLRELFAQAGLQLGDAGVSRDAPRDAPPRRDAAGRLAWGEGGDSVATLDAPGLRLRHLGLVDAWA